ncbi:MAG: hypothetical protein ACP5SK_00155 [Thermoprotei archaeon]|nr:hypothetical protein [TACK group archaeon]
MELLTLRELMPDELGALALRLKNFEVIILFDKGDKRVFLKGQASLSLPLASLVEARENRLSQISASVGLSLPYPIPLFDLQDERRNPLRESFRRCAPAFDGMGLKLSVSKASASEELRAREFCERYWRGRIFFNGWKKSYEAYLGEAREKASQLLFRASMGAIGDASLAQEMLSCISSGLYNKLILNGKSVVLCVSELAELMRPQPRTCSICTSRVMKRTRVPAGQAFTSREPKALAYRAPPGTLPRQGRG